MVPELVEKHVACAMHGAELHEHASRNSSPHMLIIGHGALRVVGRLEMTSNCHY